MTLEHHGDSREKPDGLPETARDQFPLSLKCVLFSLAYFICAEVGYHLSEPGTSSSFWLPAGLYVAALLLNDYRSWPWFIAAALPANLVFDLLQKTPIPLVLCFYTGSTIQAVLGAWLMRRFVAERPALATLKEFIGLVAFVGILSTVFGATVGAYALTALKLSPSFLESLKVLWGSGAMAVLILSPFLLTWLSPRPKWNRPAPEPGRALEAALLFSGLILLTWSVMSTDQGVMISYKSRVLPLLLWAGLRFGVRGASAANLLLSLLMAFFTVQHLKTLAPDPAVSDEHITTLQSFLAIAALVGIIPAIVLNERDKTLAELRNSEEKFSKAFRLSPDVMSICELETGRYIEVNEVHEKVFGFNREEAIGRSPRELGILEKSSRQEQYEQGIKKGGSLRDVEVEAFNRRGDRLTVLVSAETFELGGHKYILRVSRNITESKRTEQALRNSEEKFSKAFRTGPDSMTLTELDSGRYVDVNAGFHKMFGYSREETIGRTSSELGIWGEGGREAFVEAVQGTQSLRDREFKMRHRNGNDIVVLVSSEFIELDGKTCVVSVAHDITEHRKAENALRESEARLHAAFNNIPFDFWMMDADGRYQLQNATSVRRWGNLVGKRLEELSLPAAFEQELAENNARAMRGKVVQRQFRVVRRDTESIYTGITAPVLVDDQTRGLLGINIDITDRVKAEESLRESERVLSTLLSNLPGLVYRCRNDTDWTMEFVSEGSRGLTGYAPEDLINNRRISYAKLIHPDDQQPVWDQVQAALQRRTPFELNYRIRTADGAEKWMWERGQGIFLPDGTLLALEGFITDITAQRQAESERNAATLRERQAREEFTRELIGSQEAERRRIAGELHDSLGQNLLLIKNRAQLALPLSAASPALREQVEGIRDVATQSIQEVRQISHDLHPYQLDHLGLARALDAMIENAAQSTQIAFERKLDALDDALSPDSATNLYRIAQECLNNIIKHAQAGRVQITLERDVLHVRLLVEDDGKSFNVEQVLCGAQPGGLGLRNIVERVRIMNGNVRLESQPGRGTRVEVEVPVSDGATA